jgi:subtilisin family serine protease
MYLPYGDDHLLNETPVRIPPEVTMSSLTVDTVDHDFLAAGKKTGHGTAWLWAPDVVVPPWPAWTPATDPPLVALLDTVIRPHPRLAEAAGPVPFLLFAADHDLQLPDVPTSAGNGIGRYYGHGTFIAGLIRQVAPAAQLLSLPVMDDDGKVEDGRLAEAIRQLADYQDRHRRRLVVLMPFGRSAETEHPAADEDLQEVRQALARLAQPGVTIVASAGNQGIDLPQYPAAFATDPELRGYVESVGAGRSETERAPFSNFGTWVHEWLPGTNIVSVIPLAPLVQPDGEVVATPDTSTSNYCYWSGTSFAAAAFAAERAQALARASGPVATRPATA